MDKDEVYFPDIKKIMEEKEKTREFGNYLKGLRKRKGMTLKDLEEETGYSNSYLSQIENGHKGIPNRETLKKLAKGLNVHPMQLMEMAGYSGVYEADSFSEIFDAAKQTKKKIEVYLPAWEEEKLDNGLTGGRPLSDEELRRRLFDLYELLDMNVDLYYKGEFLTNDKRKKVKTVLKALFE